MYNTRDRCFSAQRRTPEGFKHLGTFKTAVEAAVAYAKDAGQYCGLARRRHATPEEHAQVHHHHTITHVFCCDVSHTCTCVCMLLGRCGKAASVAGAGCHVGESAAPRVLDGLWQRFRWAWGASL